MFWYLIIVFEGAWREGKMALVVSTLDANFSGLPENFESKLTDPDIIASGLLISWAIPADILPNEATCKPQYRLSDFFKQILNASTFN